jgi:predicted ATPase
VSTTERTKLCVFVSADSDEMDQERLVAADAVARMRFTPYLSRLTPTKPGECDLFLGIYGGSGGPRAETEYEDAAAIPKLIYVRSSQDRDQGLDDFLKRIQRDDQVSYKRFGSVDELKELIQEDLALTLAERYESGRTRHVVVGTSHIPRPLSPLIGRSREVNEVRDTITRSGVRLVTLVGAGGIGKTRVVLEATAELHAFFPDGMNYTALAPVHDPEQVIPTIARTMGVRQGTRAFESLVRSLGGRQVLLVLDNFEHVIDAAPSIGELLASAPGLKVVVTSRAALNLRGENTIEIEPLDVAEDALSYPECSAVQLFVTRAEEVRPDIVWDEAALGHVAAICRRLDGLPLAIELAAARTRVLTPEQLAERLTGSFDLLRSRSRDIPDRQKTLEDTIDWSYQLLEPDERKALEALSVFPSFFTLDGAEAVVATDEDVLIQISSLLDQSLLRRVDLGTPVAWFGMLETIRQFATTRLEESGEYDNVHRRHARWLASVIARAHQEVRGPKQEAWLDRAEFGRHNVRAALQWCYENEPATLVRLVTGVWFFWELRGYIQEGRTWSEKALEVCPDSDESNAAGLHRIAGRFARAQGDLDAALKHHETGLGLARKIGDKSLEAPLLKDLGVVELENGRFAEARSLFEKSLELARATNNQVCIAEALNNLGVVCRFEGSWESSKEAIEESLDVFRTLEDRQGIARALMNLGTAHRGLSRFDEALDLYKQSLKEWQGVGGRWMSAEVMEHIALIAAFRGDTERAAMLLGAAERQRELIGAPWSGSERDLMDEYVQKVHRSLEETGRRAVWDVGRALDLAGAVEYALAI